MTIKYNDTEFKVGEPYPVLFRPINSGKILPDWNELFVLDLKTMDYGGKERLLIDYNHDTEQVIGYIDVNTFKVDQTGWIGDGHIVSLMDGDKASEIIKLGKAGIPWQVSPTLAMEDGESEIIKAGVTVNINGMELPGPYTIYRNVPVLGISICPYGRDNETNAILGIIKTNNLKKKGKKMAKQTLNESDDKKDELSDKDVEVEDEVKDEVLAKFTKRFGAEKGVKLYQSGADYDKIEESLATLTKAGISRVPLSDEEEDDPNKKLNTDGKENGDEDNPKPTPDDKKPDDEMKKLKAQITTLSNKIDRLSSNHRGETEPISQTSGKDKPATLAAQLQAKFPKK